MVRLPAEARDVSLVERSRSKVTELWTGGLTSLGSISGRGKRCITFFQEARLVEGHVLGDNEPEREDDHSPRLVLRLRNIENVWSCVSILPHAFRVRIWAAVPFISVG